MLCGGGISSQAAQSYAEARNAAMQLFERMEPQGFLTQLLGVVVWICRTIGSLIVAFIFTIMGDILQEKDFITFGVFLLAGLFFFAIGLCVSVLRNKIIGKHIAKVAEEGGIEQCDNNLDAAIARICRELEVPEGAREMDVIQMKFQWKNGKARAFAKGEDDTPYSNIPLWVFRKGENLCFADRWVEQETGCVSRLL